MEFKWKKDKLELHFSEREIDRLFSRKYLIFEYENIKHLSNHFGALGAHLTMMSDKTNPELTNLKTKPYTTIDGD